MRKDNMKPKLKIHPDRKKKFLPVFMPTYFRVVVRTKEANYIARIDKIDYTSNAAYITCTI